MIPRQEFPLGIYSSRRDRGSSFIAASSPYLGLQGTSTLLKTSKSDLSFKFGTAISGASCQTSVPTECFDCLESRIREKADRNPRRSTTGWWTSRTPWDRDRSRCSVYGHPNKTNPMESLYTGQGRQCPSEPIEAILPLRKSGARRTGGVGRH